MANLIGTLNEARVRILSFLINCLRHLKLYKVCAWQYLDKCFKFKVYQNPCSFLLYFFPIKECPGLCWYRGKIRKQIRKKIYAFLYFLKKYGKFRSILIGHFIKHKHLISKEWSPRKGNSWQEWKTVILYSYMELLKQELNGKDENWGIIVKGTTMYFRRIRG